tara:strand:- start:445 stop:930 length:486 start_codon:yes stop_codon:yes gene_type:complete
MHKKNNNSLTKNFIQGLRPLSNTLPPQIKKILRKNGFNLSSIVDNWSKIVGKDISNKCYPIKLKAQANSKDVSLVLNVLHGKEIDVEYNKKNIIDKINSYFGHTYIKSINIKIIYTEYTNLKKIKYLKKDKGHFNTSLNKVKDINLKNKLEKLINAFNEKK